MKFRGTIFACRLNGKLQPIHFTTIKPCGGKEQQAISVWLLDGLDLLVIFGDFLGMANRLGTVIVAIWGLFLFGDWAGAIVGGITNLSILFLLAKEIGSWPELGTDFLVVMLIISWFGDGCATRLSCMGGGDFFSSIMQLIWSLSLLISVPVNFDVKICKPLLWLSLNCTTSSNSSFCSLTFSPSSCISASFEAFKSFMSKISLRVLLCLELDESLYQIPRFEIFEFTPEQLLTA